MHDQSQFPRRDRNRRTTFSRLQLHDRCVTVSDAYTYPRYSTWFDTQAGAWEIVRWTSPREMEVIQTNIYTTEKAQQALAQWDERARLARSTTP